MTDAVVPKAAEERIPLRGEDRSVSDWRRIRDEPLGDFFTDTVFSPILQLRFPEPRGKLEDSARGGNFSYSARNGREDSRSSRASVGEGKLVNVWRELDRMKREDRVSKYVKFFLHCNRIPPFAGGIRFAAECR